MSSLHPPQGPDPLRGRTRGRGLPWASMGLLLALATSACNGLGKKGGPEEPPPAPPLGRDLSEGRALLRWSPPKDRVLESLGLEIDSMGAWVALPTETDWEALGPGIALVGGLEPGTYRARIQYGPRVGDQDTEEGGPEALTLPPGEPFTVQAPPERMRFLDLTSDLGLEEPLGLRCALAFPWRSKVDAPTARGDLGDLRGDLENLSHDVLGLALGPVSPIGRYGVVQLERAREVLLRPIDEGEEVELFPMLSPTVLCVVDLRLGLDPDRDALLELRIFDLAHRRYDDEVGVRPVWNRRLLIFEDFVPVDGARLSGDERVDELLRAFRLLLHEAVRDPLLTTYREHIRASGSGLWTDSEAKTRTLEILGSYIPIEHNVELERDLENYGEVEATLLFPRARNAEAAPRGPAADGGAPPSNSGGSRDGGSPNDEAAETSGDDEAVGGPEVAPGDASADRVFPGAPNAGDGS